ncbi:glucosaminidase domain-containing protein [Planomicrobium sp. CPCC 101079]|uniref:glucosaminidase domain-containing protein n=1 Tax=Planomicrobium sp. CPCC 101079 TaxID=2599618 RepID=UPI0011B5FC83|nr:glucosaminidase domain-containing protein [Planomicrobium sp. CPCC 101079]TWT03673.1 conjugal transfer protein [Planomicrobium sp. CPCC 101079]
MTSPISSNWLNQMAMASMAQAMPSINQMGTSMNQVGSGMNANSMFMMLLQAAMQGAQTANASVPQTQQPIVNNQFFIQMPSTYNPAIASDAAPAAAAETTGADGKPVDMSTTPGTTNTGSANGLEFKPAQFMKMDSTLDGKLSGTAVHFINAGKKYNIDPNLLTAIAKHETGNGTSRAVNEKNNVAGMMGKDGLRSYGSVEESIFDMARNLRQNYLDQGKDTIAEIGAKYAPVGAANDPTGLNNHWTNGVTRNFNNIG